jgi:SagB-type dehydrogenase family enzyme
MLIDPMDVAGKSLLSVDEAAKQEPARRALERDNLDTVLRYHRETKHHFSHFARGPGHLDWANQPDPFRRYEGASLTFLPRLNPGDAPVSPRYEDLYRPGAIPSASLSACSLSRLFEYALAISAWKQAGDVRWALRTNPSSGNLHPTEAYLLIDRIAGLSTDPALHHYAAREHALELRARWPDDGFQNLLKGFPHGAFLLGLTSVIWRETWKYGERAFRYCQHDVGHAIGSLRIAARALGWRMLLLDAVSDDTLAALLGIARGEDFEDAEREHPDCIAVIWPADGAAGTATAAANRLPLSLAADAVRDTARCVWRGKANRLSRGEPVRWEILDQVVAASWKSSQEPTVIELAPGAHEVHTNDHATCCDPQRPSAARIIRQRRSALAFDGTTAISHRTFFKMLTRVMPGVEREVCARAMPWDVLPWLPAIHLAIFVHRVEGLARGLHLLARDPAQVDSLRSAMHPHFDWTSPTGCPDGLPFFLLQEGDARALAAELSCGQDVAGAGAFSLAMIAEFDRPLRRHGPWFYRRLFWETGAIGQVLYLEAEAVGVRATGLGCFFDDPVHQVLGLEDASFQSLYHFTVGGPVEDARLITSPPYGPGSSGDLP